MRKSWLQFQKWGVVILLSLALMLAGCGADNADGSENGNNHSNPAEQPGNSNNNGNGGEMDGGKEKGDEEPLTDVQQIERLGEKVLQALKNKDAEALAELAHSKGVRFTPYTNVRVDDDIVLSKEELRTAFADDTKRIWGAFDGSGDAIDMTFSEYYERFIFDRDYTQAEQVAVDEVIGQGNIINNIAEVYADGHFIEYYFAGNAELEGLDWSSLTLVFERDGEEWKLVGIAHGEWTI